LLLPHGSISAPFSQQLLMCALLCDHASMEHNDLIGMCDSGKPVPMINKLAYGTSHETKSVGASLRNDQQSSPLTNLPNIVLNFLLGVRIQC
jgi:hypothetical protein